VTRLVVRPASTDEVSVVVRICAEARLPIVPQGGNTGLVGGGLPSEDGHNIVLALGRMNRIREIDPANFTMTAEPGCILAHLQQAGAEVDRLFPLLRERVGRERWVPSASSLRDPEALPKAVRNRCGGISVPRTNRI
jgi:FAD/FMN-containing dehydrogenase